MRILFDQGTPIPIRRFLSAHVVRTAAEEGWSTLRNSELLDAAEASGFDLIVTADQSIKYQQNLSGRKLALVVLGSNIWPVVRNHGDAIAARINAAKPGSYDFIEMPHPPKPRSWSTA